MPENEFLIDALQCIEEQYQNVDKRRYWMVRTDDGRNFDYFDANNIVALNLPNYPVQDLLSVCIAYPTVSQRIDVIKGQLRTMIDAGTLRLHNMESERGQASSISRLAKQIYDLGITMKRGDIVVIPSHGAFRVKIGRVVDDGVAISNNHVFPIHRQVEWLKDISKRLLDPCLYRAMGAHQAVCDISKYSEFIDRNYTSYFTCGDKFHYVLTINTENVSARKLTSLLSSVLDEVQNFSDYYRLDVDVDSINFSINVNSPGKFSFISSASTAAVVMAVVVALCGGNIQYGEFETSTNGVFRTVVDCVIDWERAQNRDDQGRNTMFESCMHSLELQSVEQWNTTVDEALEHNNVEEERILDE